MVKTALDLNPDEWKNYALPQRSLTLDQQVRWEKVWQLIPKLAKLLREEFGALKIKVFGSATHIEYFSTESDIDLAVWGIPSTRYLAAALAVDEFDPNFKVDLVDPTLCHLKLRETIDTEGIDV